MRKSLVVALYIVSMSATATAAQETFQFVEKPTYYEGEGMRGYSAVIKFGRHRRVQIGAVCEYYSPAFAAFEVTVYQADGTPINYDLSNGRGQFVRTSYNYNKEPHEFYLVTCGRDKRFKKYLENSVRE